MAFGFGLPGFTSANPEDDAALSPAMLAFLRGQQPGAGGLPSPTAIPNAPSDAGQGGAISPSAPIPFGLLPPMQRGPSADDEPAAKAPGSSGFTPPTTPTGVATPVGVLKLPSIGSVLQGMTAGATETGDTLTDFGSHIGSALGDMVGRSKDLIGRMQSGEISPSQFLSGAVSHARDAAMAGPNFSRDFLAGKIDPGSEAAAGGAFGAAATAMTGSLPFKVPAGALRTFGGRAAATADHTALDRAAGMQAAGASPESIWQGTGWGLGRDGVPRFEIPDDAARLRPHDGSPTNSLGSLIDHPALFEAYPQLRDVNVFHRPELGPNAAADPARNRIALNLSDPQALDSLLHETQHLVQRTEGFAPGASPIDPALAAHPQVAEAAALRQRLAGLDAPEALALADRTDQAARMSAYRTAAGEVEARNVEARRGMTPAERSATPPWRTEDVPADRQWIPAGQGGSVTGDAAQLRIVPPPSAPAPPQAGLTSALAAGGAAIASGGAALGTLGDAQARGLLADRIVGAESSGNATAKNPNSSATGAGQFISGTWLDMMKKYRPDLAGSLPKEQLLALRNDAALSREMVAHYAEENGAKLRAAGLPDNDGTRYLSHFAGSKGAKSILSADPATPAAQVLEPAQVAANPFVRKMTAGQLADWAAQKVGGSAPRMTLPGGSSDPGRFGLSGPTQDRAPTAAKPVSAPTAEDKSIDALIAQLAKSKGGAGGLGFASGSSAPEGGGGPMPSMPAPQRRPFGFMTFAGQRPRAATAHKPTTRRPA